MEKAGTYEDDEEQPPSSVKHKHAFSDITSLHLSTALTAALCYPAFCCFRYRKVQE